MLKKILPLAFLCVSAFVFGQSAWTDIQESAISTTGERRIIPKKYRTVTLDLQQFQQAVAQAPLRFAEPAAENHLQVSVPMPDGTSKAFRLYESPVMHADLQAQYPEIRCYTGIGITDPTATLKCDITPHGFHGMILSAQHNTVFIDPYSTEDMAHYVVYYKKDYSKQNDTGFACDTEGEPFEMPVDLKDHGTPDNSGDCMYRNYRLALACTGEYAAFHGGTVALALAAMNTTMNRVNGVYEREASIHMTIVANNNLLVYLNASTDPYANTNGGTMLGQNVTNCNAVIGVGNYDIGHVFSTGGGGIAGLGVVCGSGKARGVTGSSAPIGDAFDIDYVAHEMGHQFSGNHSFNNSCGGNINNSTAMEPGSGSSIMSYAGICPPDVQAHSDEYFAAINLQEIGNFIVSGTGGTCPVETLTSNHSPTVNGGADFTIPKSTPFALTGVGADIDGDALTYSWEQMDSESATMPPVSTNTVGPMFRVLNPVASPTRYFPNLPDLLAGVNSMWEELPSVARTMKFRVVVRDNRAGNGCTGEDNVVITVANVGPFQVTAPNTNVTWYVGETKTVTWNVNSTNIAPINTANVKISLSTDGGLTYPVVLLSSTANDGSADVLVPSNISTTCRVKVEALNNVYFDVSDVNFQIAQPLVPTFLMNTSTTSMSVCAGTTGNFTVSIGSVLGFSNPVSVTVTGGPIGSSIVASPNPVTPVGTTTVTVSNLTAVMAGNYNLTVSAVSGSTTQTSNIALTVLPGTPTGAASAVSPANGTSGISLTPTLSWSGINFAETYTIEVATNPSFGAGSIVATGNSTVASYLVTPALAAGTVYYWRVKATNLCGQTGFSALFSFQTGAVTCNNNFSSTNVPVAISTSGTPTATSTLAISESHTFSDVNANLTINHSYLGDIKATLVSPTGAVKILFDRPGVPASTYGCSYDNILATFDDEATNTADNLETTCGTGNPSISGTYQSVDPLLALDGGNTQGTWSLVVTDAEDGDGGSIVSWGLSFCYVGAIPAETLVSNQLLTVLSGSSTAIPTANLNATTTGTTSQTVYTITALPQHGSLLVSGVAIGVGGQFTQAMINAGQVVYVHDGSATSTDNFLFDVVDINNNHWLYNQLFNIAIIQNNLTASAAASANINCHNGNTGQITATSGGGTGPFTYSLNGGAPQGSNVFSGLSAGTYTIVVTDVNSFTATTNTVVLDNPTAITANSSVTVDVITVAASGGTGSLMYSLNGGTFQSSNVFAGLPNGVYLVTVMDANGCSTTTQAIVAVNSMVTALNVQIDLMCAGQNTGELVAVVSGGQSPFQYSLNGGNAQASPVFSNLAPGTYTVIVTDGFGLTATTNTVVLSAPSAIAASASANLNTVTVTASGGTGALTYSLDGTNYQSSNIFSGLANGSYTITVRDANGCTTTTTAQVNIAPLAGNATVTSHVLCHGFATGIITVNAVNGLAPYQYSIDGGNYQTSNVFNNLAAGNHTIQVKDAANTVITLTATISEPTALMVTANIVANDVTPAGSGGTPNYLYALDGGTPVPFMVFTNVTNGTHTLTITDANGCSETVTFIMNYTVLTAGTTSLMPHCFDGNDGSITVTATGGVPPYSYSINGVDYFTGNVFATLHAGNYTVYVKDNVGDIITVNASVGQPLALTAISVVTGNAVEVQSVANGTAPYLYSLDGGSFQTGNVFNNVSVGNHTITIQDANGCLAQVTATVLANTLTISPLYIESVSCAGEADGSTEICINGGYMPYEVTMTPELGTVDFGPGGCNFDILVTDLPPGNYTFSVLDIAGYTTAITINIPDANPIFASATANTNDVTVTATGGFGQLTYSINGVDYQTSNVFNDLANGTYTVYVSDENDCIVTTSVVVNVVGVSDVLASWKITITPNPGNGLFIATSTGQGLENFQFEVFDIAGKRLWSNALHGTRDQIDIARFADGTYVLRISTANETASVRLIKQD